MVQPSENIVNRVPAFFRNAFAALNSKNYLLWFIGQMASLVGTWMQTTAQGFLIFELTHSAVYLGYVAFASGLPALLMLYGGVVIDRMPRRNLLLITQVSMMILALILAGLTFIDLVQPWHILALAFLLGIANAFDAPARQAFVVDLVERRDLTNAIALNSTMFQLATVIGPAVAGITYAAFGAAWCFTLNGISFIAVITALLSMRIQPLHKEPGKASALGQMAEGLRYSMKQPMLRTLIVLISATALFTIAFMTLFPAWAVVVLHGDATTNGWLQSARGVGALIGALTIAALGRFNWKGRLLTIGTFFYPAALIVYAVITWTPLSLLALIAVGWGFLILTNMAGTLLQLLVPEELRGRVTGVYSFVAFGTQPVGGLMAGVVAGKIGSPLTVILGAVCMLVFATGLYFLVPELRRAE